MGVDVGQSSPVWEEQRRAFMRRDCESPRAGKSGEEKGAEGRAVSAKALGWERIPLAERKNLE